MGFVYDEGLRTNMRELREPFDCAVGCWRVERGRRFQPELHAVAKRREQRNDRRVAVRYLVY